MDQRNSNVSTQSKRAFSNNCLVKWIRVSVSSHSLISMKEGEHVLIICSIIMRYVSLIPHELNEFLDF